MQLSHHIHHFRTTAKPSPHNDRSRWQSCLQNARPQKTQEKGDQVKYNIIA
jgi:hypothetical protein